MFRLQSYLSMLFLATALLAFSSCAEQPKTTSYEAQVMHAFLLYCLPAISLQDSVSRVAEMSSLPEMPEQLARPILHGQPGKVFFLPAVGRGAVLSAPAFPMCSILVERLEPQKFIAEIDQWFDPTVSPFKLKEDVSSPEGDLARQYTADVNGSHLLLLVNVRHERKKNALQAMITVGRTSGN